MDAVQSNTVSWTWPTSSVSWGVAWIATPAAKSGTSGWGHKVVGCCSHSLPHQIPEMYTAVRILRWLFLRYVRTINLSCCLVVDLGSPVCLLSATLPVLANRSLSLCMLRGSAQLVWHWIAFRTETAFTCNAIFFRFKPAAPLDAFKRGQFFVVVAFVLLSTVARLTVTKLCACQHHVPSYCACYWLSKIAWRF